MARSSNNAQDDHGRAIVDFGNFVRATRDSGYRSHVHALFELIDNSIEAGASHVEVGITTHGGSISILVADDGVGMTPRSLQEALRFGGSSRFDGRSGIGRFGMGLPNSSLSQSRRVDVRTWRRPGVVWHAHLDIDEVVIHQRTTLAAPRRTRGWQSPTASPTGTVVAWTRCDRLEGLPVRTIERQLIEEAGRVYRYFIAEGLQVSVNGRIVAATDPLLLGIGGSKVGADQFGRVLEYELDGPALGLAEPTTVRVRFSELRIGGLSKLSNVEKRRLGIVRGAGVSVIRARRELDYGWYFMGTKRRENYDDWWRCEVTFDAVADELFGLTNAKQSVRPNATLLEVLVPDMEAVGRLLNARVRKTFEALKQADLSARSERLATIADALLPPLPRTGGNAMLAEFLRRRAPELRSALDEARSSVRYRVRVAEIPNTNAFDFLVEDGRLFLVLNARHPIVTDIYLPLANDPDAALGREGLELLLLALARAEARMEGATHSYRSDWSDTLATFLADGA